MGVKSKDLFCERKAEGKAGVGIAAAIFSSSGWQMGMLGFGSRRLTFLICFPTDRDDREEERAAYKGFGSYLSREEMIDLFSRPAASRLVATGHTV